MNLRSLLISGLLLGAASSFMFGETNVSESNLVLLPVHNDPTVSFRIWFKVGSENDPAGKEGLAAITAAMLTDGSTQKNSYEQILDKLFPLAASYAASSSVEMTIVSGRTHKDNLREFYPLLMDAILSPGFRQEDLDRIKSQTLNTLENVLRYANDEELGKAVLYNTIFAGTPYGHITAGLIENVKSITLDDVRSFYEHYYTRENVVIGLGGGYDESLVGQVGQDLGKLPAGIPPPVAAPRPQPVRGFSVTIVEKDAPATAISMGFPIDVVRGQKDWYALAIANSWLGEHRNASSHLYQVIREERGLNYGDYSYIENFPGGGMRQMPPQNVCRRQQIFEMWVRPVPNDTRHFALRAALCEFKHLADKGMSESEFTLTRNFLKKYILHYAATTMERLGYALDDRFYGIQGSHLDVFRSMLEKLTLADVNAAIKKHLQYGNMVIAIVTKDAPSFKDALVNDTASPITYKTPKPAEVLTKDKEIALFPLNIKSGDVRIIPVGDLFVK